MARNKGSSQDAETLDGRSTGDHPAQTRTIKISPRGKKSLRKCESGEQKLLNDAIDGLALDPKPRGSHQLNGQSAWRLTVNYRLRIVYEFEEDGSILITYAGRKEGVPY